MSHTYYVYILASRSCNLHTRVANGNRARWGRGESLMLFASFSSLSSRTRTPLSRRLAVIPNPVAVFCKRG